MTDIYLPAAAGAYAVAIHVVDAKATDIEDATSVRYPLIVAWRIPGDIGPGGIAEPVFADIDEANAIWLPDHDSRLRCLAYARSGDTLEEAQQVTLQHARIEAEAVHTAAAAVKAAAAKKAVA
jgi:hypothetical protein